ncbi:MAG: MFS transporter [Alphaproteobacteria bacterium]|nr:MFS transporter [Alphaproteobacteria bacterium]
MILEDAPAALRPTAARRSYTLVILTLVYVVNYLDRQILGILLPFIQRDFHLDDAQAGLLSGTVFAVVYATLGIPLATLADRLSRRNIIAASLATFGLMTVMSGYAIRFWQLLVTRFGTGVGEAGTGPAISSMIADLYPPEKRASALAFYSAGLNVGLLVGFFVGGWILQHYGWRAAFVASGIPGLLLVALLMLSVDEPIRGAVDAIKDREPAPSLWATTRYLARIPSFRWISIGCSMSAFGGYAGLYFIPKFLFVSHHMQPEAIGVALALLTGTAGALGTYLSGVFADKLGARDVRWNMFVPIVAAFFALPFTPVFYLAQSTWVALAAAIGPSLMGAAYLGPSYAMTQALVPLRMRAQAVAILLFILNMIALGLGPLTVGLVSDALRPLVGSDSLRYALMTGMLTSMTGAFCYWRASRTLTADIAGVVAGVAASRQA